ncbi:MAG TPA: hypothetical protein DGG95_04170 [Cytophagales bacterium]|jgi:hypothetical protein|nr:hypothetical protein [Cytophagales bacterium]
MLLSKNIFLNSIVLIVLILLIGCRKDRIQLISFKEQKLCDKISQEKTRGRPFFSKPPQVSNNTLSLSIAAVAECKSENYGALKYSGDTLRLLFIPKGLYLGPDYIIQKGYTPENNSFVETTFCDCYYEMTYEISGINLIPKMVFINRVHVFGVIDLHSN